MEQYKEKLEEAKKLYKSANNDQKHVLESLFPELKELEDEVIKKKVIALVKSRFVGLPQGEKYVAWIEKQSESDETKAKMFLIKKGYPIDANGTFPTYKEMCNIIRERLKKIAETSVIICDPDAYRIGFADGEAHAKEEMTTAYSEEDEKQGDNLVKNGYTNNKDYIRYADRYSYEIWRKLMDNFKNIKDYHIGCNEVSDIVLNAIIDTFNWLEKGGDKNKVSKHVEAINEEKVDDVNKVEPKDYNSIDPHFGKPADKVEPKFKVKKGEWYVCTDTFVSRGKIIAIKGQTYQSKQEDNTITCEDNCLFIDRHDGKASDYFRPWTIQDAKEGDVLFHSDSASNGIFIFKEIIDKGFTKEVICYCDYDSEDHFCLGEHHTCCWADVKILHPATKEQCDTLEKAMTDAGYIFDFESKELKKLGQSEVTKMSDQEEIAEIPFGTKDSELQEATYFIPKGFHAEIDNDKVVIKKGEKPTAWSEEDEKRIFRIKLSLQKDMMAHKHSGCDIADLQNCEDWLMNLYESHRVQPQPKQEWSERDKEEFQIVIDTLVEAGQHDPAHWLKSLKQRIGG